MVFILLFVHYSDTMPHYCIVPLCNNRSGTPEVAGLSFYRLPMKDPALLKLWLIRIRRENIPVNQYSSVQCTLRVGERLGKRTFQVCLHGQRKPVVHHLKSVTSRDSCLLEDAQPTEDLYCNQEIVDLEGMVE